MMINEEEFRKLIKKTIKELQPVLDRLKEYDKQQKDDYNGL